MTKQPHHELPTVRIHSILLENFKSVEYGKIETACSKKFVEQDTQSDILGIYGQNGSGKTSLIEALAILKYLAMGESIPDEYADCIKKDAVQSHLEFTFDFQYPSGKIHKIIYGVYLSAEEPGKNDDSIENSFIDESIDMDIKEKHLVKVQREYIKASGGFEDRKGLHTVIDTNKDPFGPATNRKLFLKDPKSIMGLVANRAVAMNLSQSFIFMDDTLRIFFDMIDISEYVDIIFDLHNFALAYLYVVDTKSSGLIRLNVAMPILIRRIRAGELAALSRIVLGINSPNKLPEEVFNDVKTVFDNLNIVLCKLIPGLTVGIKDLGPVMLKHGKTGKYAELVSIRNGIELPLRDESDGVKKIISTLQLFIEAYNDRSLTVAIDEFDAGVFEYLLGEMLTIFEEYGKGQFIFTSHNLRPLEVINKDFICFTTTNPKNRYTRLDNIKPTNNLRNIYFREIELGGEKEELYLKEKQFRIVQALRKAGQVYGEEE